MNSKLRGQLRVFDRTCRQYDRKIIPLVWDLFHGKQVDDRISGLEANKGKFVLGCGYAGLVRKHLHSSRGIDGRELELRYNASTVELVKSQPQVGEAMYKAGEAQHNFRIDVDEEHLGEGEVGKVLATSDDRQLREKAWRAQEQSLSLAPLKLAVVSALNAASKALPEPRGSFAQVVLEAQDSAVQQLQSMIIDFELATRGAMSSFMDEIRSFSGLHKLEPWDVQFHVSRYLSAAKGDLILHDPAHAMGLLKETLRQMGFGSSRLRLQSEAIDKAPFMFHIEGGDAWLPEECAMWAGAGTRDYRVFINPKLSPLGLDFTRTLLLEAERAVHYYALDSLKARAIFKWDSDCMRHALAMVFDSLVEDARWLTDVAKVAPADAAELSRLLKLKKLMMARGLASAALFEVRLYGGADPAAAFRGVQDLFAPAPSEYDVSGRWAWHPHLAFNPAGQLSYVLGYLLSKRIEADIRSRFGGELLHPDAGEYLAEKYYAGYQKPWPERIRL